jgi:hypothetical protein
MDWYRDREPEDKICHIRILKHPRLEAGRIYLAEKDSLGNFYLEEQGETVWKWEAEIVPLDYEVEE